MNANHYSDDSPARRRVLDTATGLFYSEGVRAVGQPVLIGGTMGTASYILVGTLDGERLSFSSSCHGAGRAMSRHKALHTWKGRQVIDELAARGIIVKSPSSRGVAVPLRNRGSWARLVSALSPP